VPEVEQGHPLARELGAGKNFEVFISSKSDMCIRDTFLDTNFCFWLPLIRKFCIYHLSTEVAKTFRLYHSVLWIVEYIESGVKLMTV
jgi:hypothetical protein